MRNRQQYMRHRAGAPLWSPFGGMVVAPPRWCSAMAPMRWTGTCDTDNTISCRKTLFFVGKPNFLWENIIFFVGKHNFTWESLNFCRKTLFFVGKPYISWEYLIFRRKTLFFVGKPSAAFRNPHAENPPYGKPRETGERSRGFGRHP